MVPLVVVAVNCFVLIHRTIFELHCDLFALYCGLLSLDIFWIHFRQVEVLRA